MATKALRLGCPSLVSSLTPAGVSVSMPPMRVVQRDRLWAITFSVSHAALAAKRPEGRWLSPTPYLRSRMAFSQLA